VPGRAGIGRRVVDRVREPAVRLLSIAAIAAVMAGVWAPGAYSAEKEAPKEPVRISSDSMEAIRAERLVVFKGDVVAEEDFLVCSDELHITYGEDNAVSDITARGHVRLYHGTRSGTSDIAVYDRVKRTLVMTGNPVVEQCSDMVKGTRITVYLDSDRALVESGGSGRVSAVIMPEKKCEDGGGPAVPDAGSGRCRWSAAPGAGE